MTGVCAECGYGENIVWHTFLRSPNYHEYVPYVPDAPPDWPPKSPEQLELGEAMKATGMARADGAELESWKARADDFIRDCVKRRVDFTAESVRQAAGDPTRPNAMGARLAAWQKLGLIVPVGMAKATRSKRHANRNMIWRPT